MLGQNTKTQGYFFKPVYYLVLWPNMIKNKLKNKLKPYGAQTLQKQNNYTFLI